MSFQIALTFEDGVTRFIECRPNEVVSDASYRQRINIPLDCRDGVCGTCKSFCESGEYELRGLRPRRGDDRGRGGGGLRPHMPDDAEVGLHHPDPGHVGRREDERLDLTAGELASNDRLSDTALAFSIKLDDRASLGFLPGQYVNITGARAPTRPGRSRSAPGRARTRSAS